MNTKKILLLIVVMMAIVYGVTAQQNDDRSVETNKHLKIFANILYNLDKYYVDEVDPGELITIGINSMLKSLDPYTCYYPAMDMENINLMTTGKYAGIGSAISKKGDYVIIRELYKNSPADKAGLLLGDVILAIDGQSAKGKGIDDISDMLKGHPGEEMIIKVQRNSESKPLEKKVIREILVMPSIPYYGLANDSTGYIHLTNFTDKSANEVRKAVMELKNKGAEALILDLRGNSGGLLTQATEIVNFFVPQNSRIFSTKGKAKNWNQDYFATNTPIAPDMPLAILIDRRSASAAEIVAGALQDLDRAVLIGEKSFGKGLIQDVHDLLYHGKMKYTTAKYYIPSGRCIQALDYSHGNSAGSVSKDSNTEYTTQNGRKVYGGGGITPDIQIQPKEDFSIISQEIVVQDIKFDFVNHYALRHRKIAPVRDFKITDKIYDEFKEYLKERKFSYVTESQHALDELTGIVKLEKYYDGSKEEIEKLKKVLRPSVDRDLELYKDEIVTLLSEQFIQRYYYLEGIIEYKVKHDKEVVKATEILADKNEYNKILH